MIEAGEHLVFPNNTGRHIILAMHCFWRDKRHLPMV